MKFVRVLAIIPLFLVSLMNVVYPFGTNPKPAVALAIAVSALGLAGIVAAFGLARHTAWGTPAALGVTGVNVVAALLALVSDTDGALVGLIVSSLSLALVFVGGSGRRNVSLA